jgi:Carboxypeptidase regulatory-like domain
MAVAQAPPTGKFEGKITDDQGNPLPGVAVEATSPVLMGRAAAVSDANGAYRLFNLPSGTYELTFTIQGFKKLIRKDVIMGLHQTIVLNATLEAATVEESVTVVGMSPLIDVKSTTKGMTMTQEMFRGLPKGRNFDSLVAVIPGTVQEDTLLGGTSVDGASGDENMYFIDGVNTNNLVNGQSAQSINLDFVDEVQFNASGYQAEYGGSMGGVINVISRRGGNSFHGEVLGYWNSKSLQTQERDILDTNEINVPPDYYYSYNDYVGTESWNRFEYGFNLGGYILRDRLWFFGSFMPIYYNIDRSLDYAIQGRDLVRDFTRTEHNWNALAKVTAQLANNLRLTAGWVDNQFKYLGGDPAGLPQAATASSTALYNSGWNYPNMSISGIIDWSIGNNFMMSARGGWFKTDQNDRVLPAGDNTPWWRFRADQPYGYIPTNNKMFPEIPAAYQHSGGWGNKSAAANEDQTLSYRSRYNINWDASYFLIAAGEHSFKGGLQFVRQGQNVYYNRATGPYVQIAWDMELHQSGINYGRGTYGWYSVRGGGNPNSGFYGDEYNVFANTYAIYLQDSWTIKNKLTLNIGLRTEKEYLPSYANPEEGWPTTAINFPFSKKMAPRLGFIYDWFGDSSFKIFGSFGIYQDVMKLDMAANSYGGFKWKSAYYWLEDWDYTKIGVNGEFPGKYLYTYDYRPPSNDITDPDIKPFSQREISLGAEKRLGENLSLSVRGVWKSVLSAIEDTAIYSLNKVGMWEEMYFISNPGSDYLKKKYDEAIAGGQLLPGTPYIPNAKREYWAVNIAAEKRFSQNWQGGASLTWSRLTGNYSGLYSSDEIRNSPNAERAFDLWYLCYDKSLQPLDGPLATDRPIVFKIYGSYSFPFGLTLGGLFDAMSGTPITEEWTLDSAGYYPFNRGNMGRTPFLTFMNLYAQYDFKLGRGTKLQISANVDNVFNVKTARRTYTLKYLDNAGPSTTEDDPLYLQRQLLYNPGWVPNPDPSILDPLYGYDFSFYPPLQVRLGIAFVF